MPTTPDPAAVADDDHLIEDLRCGAQPPTDDQLARILGAWRDDTRGDTHG